MKKFNVIKAALALVAAIGLAGCSESVFTPTEDTGIVVSKITLNETSVMLSGVKDVTTATLTAAVAPSFAYDKTVHWSTSNDCVTLSAETGSSVVVTLNKEGSCVVTAASASGSVTATCNVVCELEKTPPADLVVSSVTPVANANNVYFTWNDPEDYDNDLAYVIIESDKGPSAKVPAGVEYGWVTGLNPDTEYNFTFKSEDLSGNVSKGVALSDAVKTEVTADDVAASTATAFAVSENGGEIITFEWNVATDAVYQKMVVTAADEGSLPVVAEDDSGNKLLMTKSDSEVVVMMDSAVASVKLTGFETGKKYGVSVYELNRDFVSSEVASIEVSAAPAVSGVSVETKYTGSIIVTWTDFSDDYTYVAKATDGASSTVESAVIEPGTQLAYLTGLKTGTTYTVTVATYEGTTKLCDSAAVSVTPKTVIWQIVNSYNTSYYFAPFGTKYNIVTVAADKNATDAKYWIVRPSLSTPEDINTFSLESSTSNSLAGATGNYLCIDNVKAFPDGGDASGWGYPSGDHPYHAYALEKATIQADMGSLDYASFSLIASTVAAVDGFSPWYVWKVGSTGRYLFDTYLNVSGETSYNAGNGDYVFAYKQSIVD